MEDYKRLLRFVGPHVWVMVLAIACMWLTSIFSFSPLGLVIPAVDKLITGKQVLIVNSAYVPQAVLEAIDYVNRLSAGQLCNIIIVLLVVLILLREIFQFFQTYLMNMLAERVIRDVRRTIYDKLMNLSLDFHHNNPTGKLVSRITYDATIIRDAIAEGLTDFLFQPIQLLVYCVGVLYARSMFNISWWFVLVSLVIVPAVAYPVYAIGKKMRKISTDTQEGMSDINTSLYESFSGIAIVKAFTMENYERAQFERQNSRFYRLCLKAVKRINIISPITEFISVVSLAVVLWFGVRDVILHGLSAGGLIVFLTGVFFMVRPVKRLSRVHAVNQKSLAAARRIFEVMDEKITVEERPGAAVLAPFAGEIVLDNISFKYEENDVLRDVTLRARKSEVVAIVGPSGAGKTTLVNLLLRFYDPYRGAVRLDGTDIRDATIASLREQIGLVTQDTFLFNDTVAANIAYGRDVKARRQEIIQAAKAANAHQFIEKMPRGYQTIIGERGVKISGGEKQRLAIARAIFKNPPILVLDEATSQLDSESEILVQDAIDKLMKGRTVFVIAHRLSTIRHATSIVVLERGSIVERGTHDELIEKGGLYKKLYEMQFRDA